MTAGFSAAPPLSRLSLLLLFALAACSPQQAVVTVANEASGAIVLTAEAEATRTRIEAVAQSGDYRGLAKLADENPNFRSNEAGWASADYWYLKLRAGDDPTSQLRKLLAERPGMIGPPGGRVFVWPYVAAVRPGDVTNSVAHDMDRLAGAGEGARVRAGSVYGGYSFGVGEDGRWLWFISGEEVAGVAKPR